MRPYAYFIRLCIVLYTQFFDDFWSSAVSSCTCDIYDFVTAHFEVVITRFLLPLLGCCIYNCKRAVTISNNPIKVEKHNQVAGKTGFEPAAVARQFWRPPPCFFQLDEQSRRNIGENH